MPVPAIQGSVFGGNQPVTGSTIQLYAAGTSGTGSAATALITATVTTSDGTGNASNSNANAGNGYNGFGAGGFTISGDYTCPSADSQVYLVATGGNPGLSSGTNNAALAMMAALGSCGELSSSTHVRINEVTTVGSVAGLFPYATGYAAVGSVGNVATALAEEFNVATEYVNVGVGSAPGANLPAGYYASSLEINTLADVMAACVNSSGGGTRSGASDGTICGNLFAAATPPSGTSPTDTVGAVIDILTNPTNNVMPIFNLQASAPPFQPTLLLAPRDWTLPIVPVPQTPVAMPASGTYAAAQSVTLTSLTQGVTIYYTTDGSTPTTSSMRYTSAVPVTASETLKAIAVGRGGSSAAGTSAYVITGTPATPIFSLAPGIYTTPQVFTITSPTADAQIYMTTDGSMPTVASTLVSGSLQLDKSEAVRAIAVAGGTSSAVVTALYTYAPTTATMDTFAGGGSSTGSSLAINATIGRPEGLAMDGSGNLYIADATAQVIRKLSQATGVMTTVAGTGTSGYSGDGGPATSAMLSTPTSVAVDASSNLYIADSGNSRIREVNMTTGMITTVAGSGSFGSGGNDGPATSAQLSYPTGVAVDGKGNIYIADSYNYVVREVVAATGNMELVAGNGDPNFAGDGGLASNSELYYPLAVAVDASGNLYIADTNNRAVREVTAGTGIISTVAGRGSASCAGSTDGFGDGCAAVEAALSEPVQLAVDVNGNLFIADKGNSVVREVVAGSGVITLVAGGTFGYSGDGGPATSAALSQPNGVAVDPSGNVYIGDTNNSRVRMVSAESGVISTVAGGEGGRLSYAGDKGAATSATLRDPWEVAVDASGNVYVADLTAQVVRKVTASTGVITTVAGNGTGGYSGDGGAATGAQFSSPASVVVDASGNLYIADMYNNVVREVSAATGNIATVAGNGSPGYSGDNGAATSAQLNQPQSVAVDANGNVYIADGQNNVVREVNASSGVITTVAGSGSQGYSGDGGAATSAQLSGPAGVAVDASGNLYIVDTGNQVVREVSAANGQISTVAGNGSQGYSGDGGAPASAQLNYPQNVAVDASGNLWIADSGNGVVREVSASTGFISTVAGNGSSGFSGESGPATGLELNYPTGVAVDASGNLYVADSNNQRVRVVYP